MRIITPYKDRITEKNMQDFADMLKDAAAARSYGSSRSWYIGTDGTHEWAITTGWVEDEYLEARLAIACEDGDGRHTVYADTDTDCDLVREFIDKDMPKSVVLQMVKELLDAFLGVCGCEPGQMPELEAV